MRLDLRYWDAAAFLGWLNKEPDRYDICDQILADAEAGKCQIVTSTATFAEVFWHKPAPPRNIVLPSAAQIVAIKDLFGKSFIVPAELDRPTALLARDLLFTFAQSHGLKPMDAIHLATAIKSRARSGLACFDTWDSPLSRLNGELHRVEQLQESGAGADLYIGIPTGIAQRLPLTPADTPEPTQMQGRRAIRVIGDRPNGAADKPH